MATRESGNKPVKFQAIYDGLREQIASGVLEPDRKVTLRELAVHFGVSEIPVREAVHRLAAENWVVYTPRIGVTIVHRGDGEILEWMLALAVMDGTVTRLAADHMSPVILDRLRDLVDRQAEACAGGDADRFALWNDEFHDVIYDACPIKVLKGMIIDIKSRIYGRKVKSSFHLDPVAMQVSLNEHRTLLALLDARPLDKARIENFARWHKLAVVGAIGRNRMEPEVRSLGSSDHIEESSRLAGL